jgi:hypothetical protein
MEDGVECLFCDGVQAGHGVGSAFRRGVDVARRTSSRSYIVSVSQTKSIINTVPECWGDVRRSSTWHRFSEVRWWGRVAGQHLSFLGWGNELKPPSGRRRGRRRVRHSVAHQRRHCALCSGGAREENYIRGSGPDIIFGATQHYTGMGVSEKRTGIGPGRGPGARADGWGGVGTARRGCVGPCRNVEKPSADNKIRYIMSEQKKS